MKQISKKIKIALFAIAIILIAIGCLFINHTNSIKTNYGVYDLTEQDVRLVQYYHEPTTDESFETNKINVILKSKYGKSQKIGIDDFAIVEPIAKIKSLSYNLETIYQGDKKQFTLEDNKYSIFSLELEEGNKEKVLEAIDAIQALDMVLVAEPSYLYDTEKCAVAIDKNYSKQWGLQGTEGIHVESAWNITMGSTAVKVGIMEDGIDMNHEDLKGRVFNGNKGNYASASDSNKAHGTHVTGIIGAIHNDYGIAGVAETSMYLLDRDVSNFPDSLVYASKNNIKVINASFGYINRITNEYSQYNATHYAALANYDGLVVCAAGNDGLNTDITNHYPSGYDLPNVISVGALNENGERSSFSNYGENSVNIYAPGESILSTVPNNKYEAWSGTSMAAPHVAGVAALMLSVDPTMTGEELKRGILDRAGFATIDTPDGAQEVKTLNAFGAMQQAVRHASYRTDELFSGGRGEVSDPYLIRSEKDFRNVGLAVDAGAYAWGITKSFKLMNDIVIQGNWIPFYFPFAANFDGNGHTITYNTTVSSGRADIDYFGLFGFVTGTIKNLTLKNCNITIGAKNKQVEVVSSVGVGILAGALSCGRAENVRVTDCTIFCNATKARIGGLVGTTDYSTCYNCVVSGGDFATNTGWIGGMAGTGEISEFQNGSCQATVTKYKYKSDDFIGKIIGIAGDETGSVKADVTLVKDSDGPCIAAGTLITLADGRQVPVETLTGDEMLLVWNLQTGTFDAAPILFIDSDPVNIYEVTNLYFSDGTEVKVIYEHAFWDFDLNQYVFLRNDAAQYIGHWFNKQTTDENGQLTWTKVQLTDVVVQDEYTTSWSPVTFSHLCYYVNGMLSMPGATEGLINIFEVDAETMSYNQEALAADIEKYGLFTYEEFAEILPVSQEVFEAFNGQYLKVSIGKGLIDIETLAELLERYSEYFVG